MENKFDERLKIRIKETLEEENFEYNPNHWKALNKKKKNNKNFFFWYAAAGLLLLTSIGLGTGYFNSTKIAHPNAQEIIISKEEKKNVNDIISNEDDTLITKKDQNNKTDKSNSEQRNSIQKQQNIEFIATNKTSKKEQPKNQIFTNEITEINSFNIINSNIVPINLHSQKKIEQQILLPKISISDAMAQIEKEDELIEKTKKLMVMGIHFSPLLTSNTEVNNSEIGIAGGISVDIPLWNKFALNTGVLYSNQNMDLSSNILDNTGIVNYGDNQLNSNKAKIKGIEIPVNVRYDFTIVNKTFFVTTGFSSTSYFDEVVASEYIINTRSEITSQDNFGNKIKQYKLVPVGKETVEINSKTGFDFASLINFSVGVELPINNKRQSLAIEPFYKYSVSSVTYKNIDFSTMGIFLRYNFSFTKNKR